jgi:hypothetical protein
MCPCYQVADFTYRGRFLRGELVAGNVRTYLGGALYEDSSITAMMAMPSAERKRDRTVRLHASPHPGISDVVEGTYSIYLCTY